MIDIDHASNKKKHIYIYVFWFVIISVTNLIHKFMHIVISGGGVGVEYGTRTRRYCHDAKATGGGAKHNGMSPFLNKTSFPNGTYLLVSTMQVNGVGNYSYVVFNYLTQTY